ncbi:hypothetical protein UY416_25515 [Paenibacillus polymyxa]|uniref:hypothetical protein n=1 Tax=Paenibacillus polymyxa TaxID=1406 RepID=UPI002AB4C434|nr:hypothetical protein [Paenibacillus polymyxa]MDY8049652.1 hypothetical protein [Paenibacillus polymyxa]
MTFIEALTFYLTSLLKLVFNGFTNLLSYLSEPLSWLVWLIEGIWYFLTKLFEVVVAILDIFVSLFQFFGALLVGFLRTIKGLLWIDFGQTPIYYPSTVSIGMKTVVDALSPTGLLTVVPLVMLAIVWLFFVYKVFALLGGEVDVDA